MTSKITVYIVTNAGDNLGNIAATEKIIFNNEADADFKDTKKEGAYITRFRPKRSEALGDNQSAEQELGDYQALGAFENIIILEGYISNRIGVALDGQNAFIATMDGWENAAKQNDDFEEGRFGIEFGDMRKKDIIPVGTGTSQIGMILEFIDWDCDWEQKPARAKFVMQFRVSKGDGT